MRSRQVLTFHPPFMHKAYVSNIIYAGNNDGDDNIHNNNQANKEIWDAKIGMVNASSGDTLQSERD